MQFNSVLRVRKPCGNRLMYLRLKQGHHGFGTLLKLYLEDVAGPEMLYI